MPQLLMLKGLPGSGKTIYAKILADTSEWKRVNMDDLRAMLDNRTRNSKNKFSREDENFMQSVRLDIIASCLQDGFSVVVDDTNFAEHHRTKLEELAKAHEVDFEEKFFDVDYRECIRRDALRHDGVGSKVIEQMYQKYLAPRGYIEHIPGLPDAIMVDIDGTLAHGEGIRGPYDTSKYHLDEFDEVIATVVSHYRDKGFKIIVCSGRDEEFKQVTSDWLSKHGFEFDYIFMRKNKDKRNDGIIKVELYDENIHGKFNVHFVLDDRNRVVDAWRKRGLRVFQVADGAF